MPELFEWKPGRPRNSADRWSEVALLDATAAAYQRFVDTRYTLTTKPDQHNRRSRDVDAVLEAEDAQRIALEVTALETFSEQIHLEQKIRRLLSTVQLDLAQELPNGVVCVLPTEAFQRGTDWKSSVNAIANFLRVTAPQLSTGTHRFDLDCVPFPFQTHADPRLNVPFHFALLSPSKTQIQTDLLASVKKALLHKSEKLAEYKKAGFRTGLVLDFSEFQLTSWVEPYKAYLAAERSVGADHVDDVFHCMTGDPHRIYVMCFKGDQSFRAKLNPHNLCLGPEHTSFWNDDAAETD